MVLSNGKQARTEDNTLQVLLWFWLVIRHTGELAAASLLQGQAICLKKKQNKTVI